jgi:hypothetical protein
MATGKSCLINNRITAGVLSGFFLQMVLPRRSLELSKTGWDNSHTFRFIKQFRTIETHWKHAGN